MARFRGLIPVLLVLVMAPVMGLVASPDPTAASDGAEEALAWLRGVQLADGGFSSGFSEGSDIGATADAVIAIASAGESPATWKINGVSPIDFLRTHAPEVTSPGLAGKVALALTAAGEDPSDFGGVDLLAVISSGFDSDTGYYGGGPYDSALAILALSQGGGQAPAEAVAGLLRARQTDGSYAFDGAMTPGSGDSNTTALAVQALLVSGAGQETLPSYDYFRQSQNPDGGWTYQKPSAFGEDTDANSTALVIQALLAGGQDLSQWGDPLSALRALQQPSGALAFNAAAPSDNALATIQAIPALAGVDLTDLAGIAEARTPTGGSTAVLIGAAVLLIAALALAALAGRTAMRPGGTERS
jgi:hypothetical protein